MIRRALVTGATGFVGSHLCRALVRDGVRVAVLARPSADRARVADIASELEWIEVDLKALKGAADRIRGAAPDVVFHLAWYGVANSHRNDPAQISENVAGSLDLAQLAAEAGCRAWVGMGSQAEYGLHDAVITEATPARPVTCYGATKLAVSLLAEQLCRAGNLRFVWLRLFACYGPDDWEHWLIPSVVRTLLRAERPALTEGAQRWDYLYIDDVVRAVIAVADADHASGVFNLSSGEAVRVRDIAERIRDLIDPRLSLGFGEVPYRPDQIMHLQGDASHLTQSTGWRPVVDLDTGLARTIAWYRQREVACIQ